MLDQFITEKLKEKAGVESLRSTLTQSGKKDSNNLIAKQEEKLVGDSHNERVQIQRQIEAHNLQLHPFIDRQLRKWELQEGI